jgi:pimeloyl-ACP methyl ester carboxylesterase
MSAAGAVALFYDDCAADVAAEASRQLRPQRMSALTERPAAVAWEERPSTYVVCEADQAVHPGLQRILARRTSAQLHLRSGHSPFLSRPAELADLLARLCEGF